MLTFIDPVHIKVAGSFAMLFAWCHVWIAPSWQELSSRLQHWMVPPCVRPLSAAHEAAVHNVTSKMMLRSKM